MLPASNKGAGMNICFPDVCATPPAGAPVPYVNLGMNATAVPFAVKTFFSCVNALNQGSQVPMTLGDQAGAMSPFMGPGQVTLGNPKVFVEALPGTNLTCPAAGNNMIAPMGAVLVPSVTNVFFTLAGPAREAEVSAEALAELSRALGAAPGEEVHALLPGGAAYLRIPIFSPGTPARVYATLRRLGAERVRALILDLRHCPGGDLMSAVELAGDFLDEGALIATLTDAEGDETVLRARRERLYAFPLALLVDGRTASAAEVFAGCLKAHGRAVIVGQRTYGKGSAQQVVPGFAAPGAWYATVASLTLPDSAPIEGQGVDPDIEITEPPPPEHPYDSMGAERG